MFSSGALIEFVGDSITDARRRLDGVDGLGFGYVRMVDEALAGAGGQVRIVNRGVSGDTTRDLVRRWRQDVIELEPDVLTIYIGINDVWRRYDEGDVTTPADFERDYRTLVSAARDETDAQIILIEPFLLAIDPQQERWREDLDPKRDALSSIAAEFALPLLPLDSIMTQQARRTPRREIAADGVHPTPLGHRIIADAWLDLVRRQ